MDTITQAAKQVEAAGLPQLVSDAVTLADKLKGASGEEKKAAVLAAFEGVTDFPVGETVEALLAFKRRGCRRWCK